MREKDLFEKGFQMGRIIWFRDGDSKRATKRFRDMLPFCNISVSQVWTISPMRFAGLITGGMDRVLLERYRVMFIPDLEKLSEAEARTFIRALRLFSTYRFGMGIRLVLLSKNEVPIEILRIFEWMPVVIDSGECGSGPEEVDSKVHTLLDLASRVSEVPIRRLSERAARFLEQSVSSGEGEELLLLLVEGMKRSSGSVLRLRDILPNFSRYFGPDEELETLCN